METYSKGVPNRSIDDFVVTLVVILASSAPKMSRVCVPDVEAVEAFGTHPRTHVQFPYVYLDATS